MTSVSQNQGSTVPRIWLIALGFWFALAIVSAVALWHLHLNALSSQARELGALSRVIVEEIDRVLQDTEESLYAVRTELREGRMPMTGPGATQALRTRLVLMQLVRTVWLVDRDGQLHSASDTTPIPDLSLFSYALGQFTDENTAISRPFLDVHSHETLVALSIRVAATPDTLGDRVIASIPASSLLGTFLVASPAADTRMAVYRSDGVLLTGSKTLTPTLDEARVAESLAGSGVEMRLFRDEATRLISLHNLSRYGLNVLLTRDPVAVLAGWREAAQITAIGLVLVLTILAMSAHFVQRADQRRALAQRALQAQLSRASKLESLGTLAGGVAHDFNNILAAIVGFGEMAQDAAPLGSDLARHLDKVMQAALRGKALVEHILAFSRGGARASIVFELEPIVEEVLGLLAVSLRPGVFIERRLQARGARLRGDPTQVFEAVMILCTNALQAMPAGGLLSIQLEILRVTKPRVLFHGQLSTGNYLVLTVSDQGTGITPEVMEHLFEPFFSTRGANAGTGLGLAVVHGVVAEFGGAIDVQSTPGHGARFILYLPECTDAVSSSALPPKIAASGAGQKLLVVDDEPALVALAQEMLEGMGYEPVGYTDPVAALQAVQLDPQRYAAVISDEVMIGLSGTQLTEALRKVAPHLPVLLMSGYGGALLAQRATAVGVTRLLTKPLQRIELARALEELLR